MRFVRWSMAPAALLVLALAAAACGAAGASGSGSTEETADDQMVAFTNCMREHGVDIEAEADDEGRMRIAIGGPDGGEQDGVKGAPDPKVEEAMQACEDKLPNKGADLTPEERAELEDQLLAFAQCMREHGIDMPDPGDGGFIQKFESGNGESGDSSLSGPDFDSPEFKAAEEACEDKLPNRMGGGPSVNKEEAN